VSKSNIGKLDVVSVFLAWALLVIFILTFAYLKMFAAPDTSASPIIYSLGLFLGVALIHAILAYFNRCPHCSKCLTVQGFKTPHPASSGSWSNVVLRWFSGSIICIHCGQQVNTNGL